jgi:hypothetical protein
MKIYFTPLRPARFFHGIFRSGASVVAIRRDTPLSSAAQRCQRLPADAAGSVTPCYAPDAATDARY